jgi:dolichol-phosphate mannosyltransferase
VRPPGVCTPLERSVAQAQAVRSVAWQPLDVADIRLAIVCPMANEAEDAVSFVDALVRECGRFPFASVAFFVVVDRASTDGTRAVLDAHRAHQESLRVIWAPETKGVAHAYIRGYREALAAGCDWILEIDAGFSHSPSDVAKFFAAMTGNDCVFASRFSSGGRHRGTLRRRIVSRGGTILANRLLGTRLDDMTSGFELFTRDALESVLAGGLASKGPFFQTEIKIACRHMRVAQVPIEYRTSGESVSASAIAESFAVLIRFALRRLTGRFER